MKSKWLSMLLVLGASLAASTALAQTSGTMGYSIPHNDPNIGYGPGTNVGVVAGTSSGGDSHTITIRWEAELTFTYSTTLVLPPPSPQLSITTSPTSPAAKLVSPA